MSDQIAVTLDDQDPEGVMPVHWWGLRMEFQPFADKPGGSWTLSCPGEFWARLLEEALGQMTNQEVQDLMDQYL